MDPLTLSLLLMGSSAAAGIGGGLLGGGDPDVLQVGGPSEAEIRRIINAMRQANEEALAYGQARQNQQVVSRGALGGTLRGGLTNRGFQETAESARLARTQQEAVLAKLMADLYGAQQFQGFPTTRQRIGTALGGFGGQLGQAGMLAGVMGLGGAGSGQEVPVDRPLGGLTSGGGGYRGSIRAA